MIPLRLAVKNFMCYREDAPVLDLEGIHVACLCGDNGHGKTALLDAITWALWGRARGRQDRAGRITCPPQQELVHQGQQDMAVELEFMARGQRYRVSRKYSRPGRAGQGKPVLDLFLMGGNGVKAISGSTVRETEAKIRDLLNMDFKTFINSACLLQGQADLFTTSSPSERKQRLAEVLDLSYYERLEERAREQSKARQGEIIKADSAIAVWRRELDKRPEYEEQLASIAIALDRLEAEAASHRAKVEQLRQAVDSLSGRRRELEGLNLRLGSVHQEKASLDKQVQSHQARLSELDSTIKRSEEIRGRFAELERIKEERRGLEEARERFNDLTLKKAPFSEAVAVERQRLTGEIARCRRGIEKDLEPRANRRAQIERDLRAVEAEQASLDQHRESLHRQREEAQTLAAQLRYLEEANAALVAQMEETRRKFDMLEQGEAMCPLCRQPLGADGQVHLRREYEAHGREAKRQHQHNTAEHARLSKEREALTSRVARDQSDAEQRGLRLQAGKAVLEHDMAASRGAEEALPEAVRELERLERVMAAGEYACEQRRGLVELEAELAKVGYDAQRHRAVQERAKALEPYTDLHLKLTEAIEAVPHERQALEAARHILDRRYQEIRDAEERKPVLEEELKTLPSLESQLMDAHARHQKLDGQLKKTGVDKGILEDKLAQCDVMEAEVRQQEQMRRSLKNEKAVYDELAVAFGKNGIQALIIENAIPQLQNDANELLGRLSDNRMSLKLQLEEGRRVAGTAIPSEELQIKIADELGTRSYETFSGGEAFRVNFALRIALSKLLARRSGAPLPILFIDEGFGSQDAEGQERLKEAIQSIQREFEKIIVITHLEQVKDAFPTRIEVTKTPSGSTFVMV